MSIDLDAIRARLARVVGKWPTTGVLAPGADEFGPKAWSAHGPLRCHATEKGRARQWSQANADADFIAAAPGDLAALLAEVETLRAGLADIEQIVRDGMAVARAEGVAEGERRVVAYLRRESYPCCNQCNNQLADYIERGEHRKEEK